MSNNPSNVPPPSGFEPTDDQTQSRFAHLELPVVPLTPGEQKTYATLMHASQLVLGVFGPLVFYLATKERGNFIRRHCAAALNFSITMTIAMFVSFLLTLVLIGFLMIPVLMVLMVVMPILGAMAASKGQMFQYPLTFNFLQ